jgi:murein DD-endopeptidase MepM/ murein hydrolase activator NlpD
MKKTFDLIRLCLAVVLCATGLTTPAAAGDVPTATPLPRAGPLPRVFSTYDALEDKAASIATTQKSSSDGPAASTVVSEVPTATPAPRAAPVARSYPRSFSTYDALVEYASSIATTQQTANDQLAALLVRQEETKAALAEVFDPRLRGGLLKSRTDLIDDATLNRLRTQLASDAATARELKRAGAVVAPPASWHLPLVGEDTQDFGPTPYGFEPALTYGGVFYPHFHSGTDIAAPWGTPIVAPAWGVVVFAGTMGDGAEVVVLAHESGFVSMYAHLENRVFPLPVKAGDTVQAGDHIGNVGLTGMTTGMHLHWSVWRNGELIDPLSMIGGQ